MGFYHLALQYSCKKMRVLPAKGLVDSLGNPTTTYAIIHGKKPRIGRFKVFGCPCVFKRYAPQSDGKITTDFKQLQQGSRGLFVGFPADQAGWFIYVPEKISGSHLVVSMDVSFDQHFVSGITGMSQEFDGSQMIRNVGKSGGNLGKITEITGDITNLASSSTSHWGTEQTFDVEHEPKAFNDPNFNAASKSQDIDNSSNDNDCDSLDALLDDSDLDKAEELGTTNVEGLRRSVRKLREKMASELKIMTDERVEQAVNESEVMFAYLAQAADLEDIEIVPYLPEPKNIRQLFQCHTKFDAKQC